MPRTAKVFMTNRSQAVRLPKEFQFATDEVVDPQGRRRRHSVAATSRLASRTSQSAPVASDAFMADVEDLPVQERELLMPRFMLDTDTCSYIMKRSHPLVLKRLQSVPVDDVCMSVVTKAELLYGVQVSPRRAQDAAALAAFLPYVEAVASRRGRGAPLRGDPRRPEAARCDDRRQRPLHRGARTGTRRDPGDEQHH